MKPLTHRRIKLNRDLGRKGSTETLASDRAPSGPEKMTSTSDRSASANISEGERPSSAAEGAGRKERSASAERGVTRERPRSAGDRQQDSDREQNRSSGLNRERDRASGSDRERDRGIASDRERDRVSGSGSQKVAVTVERDSEGEKSVRTERKDSGSGGAVGRSVSLDKITIGEKTAITRRMGDHQEKPNISSRERGEGSDRAAKSSRFVFHPYPRLKEIMI